jgi:hypothetical protein
LLDFTLFHERAAHHVFDGASPAEADHRAALEQDKQDADDFYQGILAQWRDALPLSPPANCVPLLRQTTGFLASPWALQALQMRWDGLSLFGVFAGDWSGVTQRYDCWGLIPGRAYSRFPLKLVNLERDGAMLENTETGSHLWQPRHIPGAMQAVIWWEHQSLGV